MQCVTGGTRCNGSPEVFTPAEVPGTGTVPEVFTPVEVPGTGIPAVYTPAEVQGTGVVPEVYTPVVLHGAVPVVSTEAVPATVISPIETSEERKRIIKGQIKSFVKKEKVTTRDAIIVHLYEKHGFFSADFETVLEELFGTEKLKDENGSVTWNETEDEPPVKVQRTDHS